MNNNFIELDLDEIVSIEEIGIIDTVDISVKNTRMFLANDIYTHNSGFDAEIVEASQLGGSIKRVQKAHFFMSVAKPNDMKDSNLANVKIIKARFAKDGQVFRDSIFDNDKLEIKLNDEVYGNRYSKGLHKVSEENIENFNAKVEDLERDMLLNDLSGKYQAASNKVQKEDISLHTKLSQVIVPIPSLEELIAENEPKDPFVIIDMGDNAIDTSIENSLVGTYIEEVYIEELEPIHEIIPIIEEPALPMKTLNFIPLEDEPLKVEETNPTIEEIPAVIETKKEIPIVNIDNVVLLDADELESTDDDMKTMLEKIARKQNVIK